ncbi:hypothetical protein N7509_005778 [Penicillium cosmopolitanum]|uniref:Uncharacterized protein n=1 Tax=Penicillium cosmopolitanum TaxID=1131564 RepID=A0A9X0BAE1_9EURO|nr:uncharacterized protein N7509_005778 [Penicillium cosmopolitanum]KAJ5397665.1 hypothetical protein N7509_005778 [Penicillium cosmopolitanum]
MEQKRTRNLSMRTSFLHLPPELRLKIYEEALVSPNDYTDIPMIVVQNRGNVFTTRGRYRAMSICPSWEGNDGTARKLLGLNHQIHDEAEDFLYSKHTLFFRNSFDLDRIGQFLDTLSSTARDQVRSVGFEVFFFVHAEADVPKRTMKEYEHAGKLLAEKLPRWESVLFYLDPRFYYPSTLAGAPKQLLKVFSSSRLDLRHYARISLSLQYRMVTIISLKRRSRLFGEAARRNDVI